MFIISMVSILKKSFLWNFAKILMEWEFDQIQI